MLSDNTALSHSSDRTIVGTVAFTNGHTAPVDKLMKESKQTGLFENPDCSLDDTDHRNSTTGITTNIMAAIKNSSKPADPLNDDNIDTTLRNALATKA